MRIDADHAQARPPARHLDRQGGHADPDVEEGSARSVQPLAQPRELRRDRVLEPLWKSGRHVAGREQQLRLAVRPAGAARGGEHQLVCRQGEGPHLAQKRPQLRRRGGLEGAGDAERGDHLVDVRPQARVERQAVLPCILGDAEPALRRLTPEVVAMRGLSLVYRRESRLSDSVRAVVRFVVETIRGNADRIRGNAVV